MMEDLCYWINEAIIIHYEYSHETCKVKKAEEQMLQNFTHAKAHHKLNYTPITLGSHYPFIVINLQAVSF